VALGSREQILIARQYATQPRCTIAGNA
jgi:hypothetical protein